MKKIDFNFGWAYRHLGSGEEYIPVDVPHDAMLGENRTRESDGGTNTGWFEGFDYEYRKVFNSSDDIQDKTAILEFEGVYRNAEVYLNDVLITSRPYGYTNFYADITGKTKPGENEIRVVCKNADQPNSRWYSGAGIYRPVNLFVAEGEHILLNGVKIRTKSIMPAVVEISVKTSSDGEVRLNISDGKGYSESRSVKTDGCEAKIEIEIENARLWSADSPEMYCLKVCFEGDETTVPFGIRVTEMTAEKGFCINGERVIIRGCCIHHDNGILGACCYSEAEERKIKILKENGYNAIRSAHNPCSKALLDACDRLGMLVMDEYVDMWYIHKTRFDYASYTKEWYEKDLADMIDKDFNHPSVVMYSLGNEVAETGQKEGIEFFKTMKECCKKLDPDRFVTAGVNIFFNYLYAMGFGVYSDKKAVDNPQKKVGSEFFNNLTGVLGAGFMKTMAKLPGCDKKTRDCYAAMDCAGYNYGIKRYKHDLKKYPERIILGSETFCSDAYMFYEMAKNHPALIGDFVWAGIDYLGEVGIGAWEYREYAPDFLHTPGWISAGSGRIDLVGNPLGEAYYTRVAFDLEDRPMIAVVPVNSTNEKHTPSSWKFSNAIPSWSWNGLTGKPAKVEVYSKGPVIELYVNEKLAGRKKLGKNCRTVFKVKYEPGTVTAVSRDKAGNEISRYSLTSASDNTVLSITPESTAEKGKILFVKIDYTDEKGIVKPLERGDVAVSVEGGKLIGLGSGCPFNPRGYLGDVTDTYYGRALAAIRVGDVDKLTVKATTSSLENSITVDVK